MLPWPRNLVIGLALSVLLHMGLLALRFHPPAPPPAPAPERLEVILLNVLTRDSSQAPQALAQAASAGGGEQAQGMPRSPLPFQDGDTVIAEQVSETASGPAASASSAASRQILSRDNADSIKPVVAAPALTGQAIPTDPALEAPVPNEAREADSAAAELATLALQLSQQYAALSQRLEDNAQRPRQHYFAPSTSPWIFAEYVEQWRTAVEAIGNQHYPPQLRGRLYGSVQLTVTIQADGSLASIEVDTPSIHPEINEAARAILQRAAPFAPFSDALRREADSLSITRTWHFENDALLTRSP